LCGEIKCRSVINDCGLNEETREAAPSLAGFKARLDGALSTLGWWKGSLPVAGWVE